MSTNTAAYRATDINPYDTAKSATNRTAVFTTILSTYIASDRTTLESTQRTAIWPAQHPTKRAAFCYPKSATLVTTFRTTFCMPVDPTINAT